MRINNRRSFLKNLGLTIGSLTIGKDTLHSFSLNEFAQKKEKKAPVIPARFEKPAIDFKYSPPLWQSTYCFPDDPYKSLVSKHGELLYGHPGRGANYDEFPHTVSIGLAEHGSGQYVAQKLEAPNIPIISTSLEWSNIIVEMVTFATNHRDEGRVDNLLIEFRAKNAEEIRCSPEIIITSKSDFWSGEEEDSSSSRGKIGTIHFNTAEGPLFMIVDSPVERKSDSKTHRFRLQPEQLTSAKTIRYFVRFPQEGQALEKVSDRLREQEKLLAETRSFWQAWKVTEGKVTFQVMDKYQDFLVASVRNIMQVREIKDGKKVFQVGPTVYRGMWIVDGTFLLEAARYLGYDKDAQEGIEKIWNLQDEKGAIVAGAGESHWKDNAAAVYALVRQAELAQNWDYFREIYPDAVKCMMYLKDLRDKALNDGTANGKYGLLPRGFGDSGLSGIRSELTNTIWTLIALKALLEIADRFFLMKRAELRDFYRELRTAFLNAQRQEMRKHPNGFSYLPMLMGEDTQWSEKDERKQPRPQVAQVYMSHAIYPGLAFPKDLPFVDGHIDLMKAVTKEDVPIETGWLSDNAVWTYNAAIVAQVYLWAGMPDLARKTFIGFLNHASPLYAWREEQSLKDSLNPKYIGDMPHNWASAECVRYLRHMLILEDEENLRLLDGVTKDDLDIYQPMILTYSATRWGRVSITFEPLARKTWRLKFRREDFQEKFNPKLTYIDMPRRIAENFQFDKMTEGVTFYKNGPRVLVLPSHLEWEATWHDFSK